MNEEILFRLGDVEWYKLKKVWLRRVGGRNMTRVDMNEQRLQVTLKKKQKEAEEKAKKEAEENERNPK